MTPGDHARKLYHDYDCEHYEDRHNRDCLICLEAAFASATLAERERCAKVLETTPFPFATRETGVRSLREYYAAAIREEPSDGS